MNEWSASRYVRFRDERTRPARDLLAALGDAPVATATDLGCGPGNSTALLVARYGEADITGIDSAPDMIATARRTVPGARFVEERIERWADAADRSPADLVFSNAALQWVPDHHALLPRLMGRVAPGGHLAVQIPDNLAEPAQTAMRDAASDRRWARRLAGAEDARTPIGSADWFHATLRPRASSVEIWRTTYVHRLDGIDGVVDWFRGTGLLPFLAPLDEGERAAFLDRYRALIAPAFTVHADGAVLLPMPRLFVVARR